MKATTKRIVTALFIVLFLFAPARRVQKVDGAATAIIGAIGAIVGILGEVAGAASDVKEVIAIMQMVDSVKTTLKTMDSTFTSWHNKLETAAAYAQCLQQIGYCGEQCKRLLSDIVSYPSYAEANFGKDVYSSAAVVRQGMYYVKQVTAEVASVTQLVKALKDGNADAMTVRSRLSQLVAAIKNARSAWSNLVYEDLGYRSMEQLQEDRKSHSAYNFIGEGGYFSPANGMKYNFGKKTFDNGTSKAGFVVEMKTSAQMLSEHNNAKAAASAAKVYDEAVIKEEERKLSEILTGPAVSIATAIVGLIGAVAVAWQLLRYFNDSVEMGRDINPLVNTFGRIGAGMVFFAIVMEVIIKVMGRQI